jgi:hypothetical protein
MCLFSLLRECAGQDRLSLGLNLFFYLSDAQKALFKRPLLVFWQEGLALDKMPLDPGFQALQRQVDPSAEHLALYSILD